MKTDDAKRTDLIEYRQVGMCLPAGPYVTDDDVRYIVDTIKANIL